MNSIHAELVDGLQGAGHAVNVHDVGLSAAECDELLEHAARFIDAALSVAGCPTSGRAYVRVSSARGAMFVEVTHLSPGTFGVVMADSSTLEALDALRRWAERCGRSLAVERGPRDRFGATVSLMPAQATRATA